MTASLKNNNLLFILGALCIIGTWSCKSETEIKKVTFFEEVLSDSSGLDFTNQIQESATANILTYQYFYNGGGVAVGDVNQDGLEDLYFTGNQVSNKLFLNLGNLKFRDITLATGTRGRNNSWTTGATFVDINADGLMDIYVCNSGDLEESLRRNQLFVNKGLDSKGIPFYEEMAAEFGIDDPAFSTSAYFFDYDLDQDLDLLLLNHNPLLFNNLNENIFKRMLNEVDPFSMTKLYQNQGGKFVDVSLEIGLSGTTLNYALGAGIGDFNQDGWPDFYIGNDYSAPDYLYLNQQDGTFKNQLKEVMGHSSLYTMGVDVVDINQDGRLDIFSLDMLPEDNKRQKLLHSPENYEHYQLFVDVGLHHQMMRNMIQINQGNGTFSEVGQLAGISATDWSWSALFADLDNDGNKDLFVSNGFLKDFTNLDFINYRNEVLQNGSNVAIDDVIQKMPVTKVGNYAFQNHGNLKFEDVSEKWGLNFLQNSNGAAYADLDLDGDLDLIVNNLNEPSRIYENKLEAGKKNNFLQLKFRGPKGNQAGVGAKVTLFTNNGIQFQEQTIYRGFQGNVSQTLHFGLGKSRLDSLIVDWPGGFTQTLIKLQVNELIELNHLDASKSDKTKGVKDKDYVVLEEYSLEDNGKRINDFKRQSQLIYSLSDRKPDMVSGDLDGDEIPEIIMADGNDYLTIITKNGELRKLNLTGCLAGIRSLELIDVDLDGDMDLFIAKGGYDSKSTSDPCLQDLIFLNNGQGVFEHSKPELIPTTLLPTSIVKSLDINGDGVLDLFLGGEYFPGKWPDSSTSRMLINDGKGNFSEHMLSTELLHTIRRVTDLATFDIDQDGVMELIIASEFDRIRIFSFSDNEMIERTDDWIPESQNGLWRSIWIGDLNVDKSPDLLLGNWGNNSRLKASKAMPLEVYYADFDQNGSIDPFLFQEIGSDSYPFFSRDELASQMYRKKALFPTYESFAQARIQDILTEEELKSAHILTVETLETSFFSFENGKFMKKVLPIESQFAPINSIVEGNVPGEILMFGNVDRPRLKIGKQDANQGLSLKFDNKSRDLSSNAPTDNGFRLTMQVYSALWSNDLLWVYTSKPNLISYKKKLE